MLTTWMLTTILAMLLVGMILLGIIAAISEIAARRAYSPGGYAERKKAAGVNRRAHRSSPGATSLPRLTA
jgi:hypothetical protein